MFPCAAKADCATMSAIEFAFAEGTSGFMRIGITSGSLTISLSTINISSKAPEVNTSWSLSLTRMVTLYTFEVLNRSATSSCARTASLSGMKEASENSWSIPNTAMNPAARIDTTIKMDIVIFGCPDTAWPKDFITILHPLLIIIQASSSL